MTFSHAQVEAWAFMPMNERFVKSRFSAGLSGGTKL